MSRRALRRRAAVLLALALAFAAARQPPGPPDASSAAAPRLVTVADYLAAFARAYRTPFPEREGLAAAEADLAAAVLDAAPRLSVRERLQLGLGGAELELGLRLEVPLYDGTAAPRRALAAADVELRRLFAAQAREAALASLLHELAALAVLSPAADAAAGRLSGPTPAHLEALSPVRLSPRERLAFETAEVTREAALWLVATRQDVARRLARRLAVDERALVPPAVSDLERTLAEAVTLAGGEAFGAGSDEDGDVAACLARSSAVQVARARHAHAVRAAEHDTALDLRVALSGGIEGAMALGGPGGDAAVGAVGLEARLLLPAGWPVGGSLGAGAGTNAVWQELQVSWPPGRSAPPPLPDPDEQLADELALIAEDARAYLRALASARAERARSERALAWALLDLAPHLSAAEAESLAAAPWAPGWPTLALDDELGLVELRIDASLARLAELGTAIDLARHCGLLPVAGAR